MPTQPDPDQLRRGARRVAATLQRAGHTAYWAGGCVRDMLMQRPASDFDIATDANPERVMELFPGSIAVGKAFGVVRVRCGRHHYEVATFRRDFAYRDGRRPERVVFTDAATDAQRRDFTVNAIFYDPLAEEFHDFVGGRADLRQGIIRAVGEPASRFDEDHLRMLRAVRFAATLDFTIDEATADAIRAGAPKIARISAERIQHEITRILLEAARPGDALDMMAGLRLLPAVLPEVAALRGQAQPPQFHPEGDVFTHTMMMLNAMTGRDRRLAWAAMLHDIGKPPTCRDDNGRLRFNGHAAVGASVAEAIMRRMRMSNDDIQVVTHAIANHMRFMDVRRMRRATLLRLVGAPTFELELELHRLDCLASHGDLSNYDFLVEFHRALAAAPAMPQPLITGHDIMARGIREGQAVGCVKKAAYEAQLEDCFRDRESGLRWLDAHIRSQKQIPS